MAGLRPIPAEELATLQKALGLKLPPDFVRFAAVHKLPELNYMNEDDLPELCGLNARALLAFNENLRDPGLNPEGKDSWKEHYLGLGVRESDDAVFYLDLGQNAPISTVYALEPGAASGQLVSGDFSRWAAALLYQLEQEDERIRQWHERQSPAWWRWIKGIIRLK